MTDGAWTSLQGLLTKPKQVPCPPHRLRNCPWSLQDTALDCDRNQCPFSLPYCGRNKSSAYLCEAAILPCHGMWPRCPWENTLPRSTPKVPSQSEWRRKGAAKNTVILPPWFLTRIPKFHLLEINWLQHCNRNLDANQYGNSPPNFLTIPLNFFLSTLITVFHFKGENIKNIHERKSFHILQSTLWWLD